MQLTPNSLKFIVAAIILNEVEGKGITVNDLLFTFNVKKTPSKPNSPKQHLTYYLSASKKYFMFSGKLAVDKGWEIAGGLYVISGEWIPDRANFPLVNRFTQSKYCYSAFHCNKICYAICLFDKLSRFCFSYLLCYECSNPLRMH